MRTSLLRFGITARLGLVALAPALAVAIGAGSIAQSKNATRHDVTALRRQVLHFEQELLLRAALHSEQSSAQALARLPSFGISANFAGTLIGRDFAADLAERRARVDGLLDGGEVDAVIAADVRRLVTDARRQLDADRPDVDALGQAYDRATLLVATDVDEDLAQLRTASGSVGSSSARVLRAAELAHQATLVSQEGIAQSAGAAGVVFGPVAEREGRLAALMAIHTRFEVATASLLETPSSAGDKLSALLERPDLAQYVKSISDLAEAGDPNLVPDSRSPLALVGLFRGIFDFDDGLYGVADDAGTALVQAIDEVAHDAHDQFVSAVALIAAALGVTLVITVVSAGSLARPLRRLAADVRAVQSGDLDRTVVQGSVTTEIGVLQGAVADLVANLRVVDLQAEALADGRLDDAVLGEQVPGKLGAALQHSVARLQDAIADERSLRDRLAHEATHDALTGLLNRSGVLAHAGKVLAAATRRERGTALLFVDLDDFKRVNDGHGHAAGDAVLREIAARLGDAVRHGDVVGRLGGDEFVVIMVDVDEADEAVALGERLLDVTREPIVVDGDRCVVGASVGVALAADGDPDPLELLEQADVAVFRAKTRGKSRVEVFDADLQRMLEERADLARALAEGIERGEVTVHYQPIVAADDLSAVGLEALARWERPGHGMVPPGVFVPVAEDSDLVIELGRHVLRTACTTVQGLGLDGLELAVNVSARHVASGYLVDDVTEALRSSGMAAGNLTVEITETVLVTDLPFLAEQLDQLRALGVRVAIDDFGTGFTSLAHLRQLPADVIKIDRSFVSEMDGDDGSLVKLVVDLGHQLDLGVVAEGVETERQLATLRKLGCDRIQGFLLGRPQTPADLVGWLAAHARRYRLAAVSTEVE